MATMDRRSFLRQSAIAGGSLAALGPLAAYYAKSASGAVLATEGYGPLVNKGDLWLPADFNYQVLSRQGTPMSDGRPTPGIFDGMGAYRGPSRHDDPDPQPREPRAGRRAEGDHRAGASSTTS